MADSVHDWEQLGKEREMRLSHDVYDESPFHWLAHENMGHVCTNAYSDTAELRRVILTIE